MKQWALILLLFSLSMPLWAEQVLTWEDCIKLAVENNGELKAAKENLESSRATKLSNLSNFFPQLTASLGVTENSSGNTTTVGGGGGSLTSSTTTYAASINGTQNLFFGLTDFSKWELGKANVEISAASLRNIKAKISFELKSAFANALYAKESMNLAREILNRREENGRLVQLRYESGRENQGSVYLSIAYLNQAKLDLLQAKNSYRTALANLARAIGFDEHQKIDVSGTIPVTEPNTEPDFKSLALLTPDFETNKFQIEAAEANLKIAKAQFFPKLDLNGSVGRQGPDFFPDRERWSVGLNLTFPFFTGGKDYFTTTSAVHNLYSARSARDNALRHGEAKLINQYAAYTEAVMKLNVDTSFKKATEVRSEIARKKYNNGLLSFEDWDVIENDLITRQKVYLQARRDRTIAESQWEQAQGKGVID